MTATRTINLAGTKFFRDTQGYEKQLYIGIRFTINRTFESLKELNEYIQDNYFDNDKVCGGGYYWLMPQSYSDKITPTWSREIESDQDSAMRKSGNNTIAEVLFLQPDYEDIENEMEAMAEELDAFIDCQYAESWEQFPLY